jgi:hypothetical protein
MDKKRKCGLVMPVSAIGDYTEKHWVDVSDVFKEALTDTDFQVELVSDANEVGVIQKRIVQNLHDADLIICDVSAKNPNVMFELGMRLAFDKPAIIVKDVETTYSFDTAPIEHLIYPRSLHYQSVQAFKKKLREKSIATFEASQKPEYTTFLKHFGEFVVASIDAKPVSKEDYILREMRELRKEVVELAKSSRRSTGFKLPTRGPSSNAMGKMVADALLDFVARSGINPRSLLDHDSEEYERFQQQLIGDPAMVPVITAPYSQVQEYIRDAVLQLIGPTS